MRVGSYSKSCDKELKIVYWNLGLEFHKISRVNKVCVSKWFWEVVEKTLVGLFILLTIYQSQESGATLKSLLLSHILDFNLSVIQVLAQFM